MNVVHDNLKNQKVPNTFAALVPIDTHSAEVRDLEDESVLVEIDWENGTMEPIMQGPHREMMEEAKSRAYQQSAEYERDRLSEMSIEFLKYVLGFRSPDSLDYLGTPVEDELQGMVIDLMRRSPVFKTMVERYVSASTPDQFKVRPGPGREQSR